jgi:hypothetical protein
VVTGQTGGPVFAAGPLPRGGGFGDPGGGAPSAFGEVPPGLNGLPAGLPPGPFGDDVEGLPSGRPSVGPRGGDARRDNGPRAFGPGGPGRNRAADPGLIEYLQANRGGNKYLVATTNANSAAPIIIATGEPVMAMGGFTGNDPILTADQLRARVQAGEVRFFLLGGPVGPGGPGGPGGGGAAVWVQSTCATVSVPGISGPGGQLYDCGSLQGQGA